MHPISAQNDLDCLWPLPVGNAWYRELRTFEGPIVFEHVSGLPKRIGPQA